MRFWAIIDSRLQQVGRDSAHQDNQLVLVPIIDQGDLVVCRGYAVERDLADAALDTFRVFDPDQISRSCRTDR